MSTVVHDGIVMVADSCLSQGNDKMRRVLSNTFSKLWVTPYNIGISFGGNSHLNGVLLTRHLDIFLANLNAEQHKTPLQVGRALMEYASAQELDLQLHVAGYDLTDISNPMPLLYRVKTKEKAVDLINDCGLKPALVYSCATHYPELFLPFITENINNFSIQDAIDFSVFVIKTTSALFRFQGIAEIVGGPIDILVIKRSSVEWVSRKTLHI
jgi:hypothetical protein